MSLESSATAAWAGHLPEAPLRLDSYLPYRLSVASEAVSRLIARAYEDRFGLTIPQWRLVCVLAEDGPRPKTAILARTAMDRATVTRALQGLLRRDLVARIAEDREGPSNRLALTPEGQRLHADIAPLALAYEAALLAGLEPQEVRVLKRLLGRLETAALRLSSGR
jgi:DNA-binding MarR family transcriptional regulator